MQEVTLQILPGDEEIWTVEEFLEKSEDSCRQAAIELNRKSQMVEEAVEEVLELVDKASQIFQKIMGSENDMFADLSKGMYESRIMGVVFLHYLIFASNRNNF